MKYVLVKDDAATATALRNFPGWDLLKGVSGFLLLRVVNPDLIQLAKENPTRASILPSLSRSAKHLPQRMLDFLQARGIVVEADDTILDLLVKLTGDEDFE